MTLFEKIIAGELAADIVHEDEICVAFRDAYPKAPTHILVVPREPIPTLSETAEADEPMLGHCMRVAAKVAEQEGLEGFRLVINNGPSAGQTVYHLHIHVIGGRELGWPPG